MINSDWKKSFTLNAKNLIGWRTDRKIIVLSVDDYGNVRIDSKKARNQLTKAGLKANNRFDRFDALETKQDLEMLYEALRTVKDQKNRHPILTAFAVPCNINFEKVCHSGFREYYYETLPKTFQKKSELEPESYAGAWQLWEQGIKDGLMVPQFHGREHLNLKIFEEKLARKDPELLLQLENRSFTGFSKTDYETISALAAFDFWEFKENKRFKNIISDGIEQFETTFGCSPTNFTPPVYRLHQSLYQTLAENGIHFIDTALLSNDHQGKGQYKRHFNYTGQIRDGLYMMVRNVVFEPTQKKDVNWTAYAMKQIEAAFRWNRPAIISSHRVNFCGHINPLNRKQGIQALKELLSKIVTRWPEVEFMAANELGHLISSESK